MVYLRRSQERGRSELDWLTSLHTFSFNGYFDTRHMGFSALRVLNEDRVAPGKGFAPHRHDDMEIISYILDGTIKHEDNIGNTSILPKGCFQVMSAGHGVMHSEYNPSSSHFLTFLQIWIQPNQFDIRPDYQEKVFHPHKGLQPIATPDKREGSLLLHQDAFLYHLRLDQGQEESYALSSKRSFYLHMIEGKLQLDNWILEAGDGIGLSTSASIIFQAVDKVDALFFDLP